MSAWLERLLPFGLIALVSAWLVSTIGDTADWSHDTWPAVHALAQGRVSDYLSAEALMGPVATLVQAPFVWLAGGEGELVAYRYAAFPCVLAAGLLGLYLAALARRRGSQRPARFLIAALCLVNPLTIEALRNGHPEEILTAVLAVAAVATASEGHRGRAAVLLGLAVACKQWAVIAILPTLMALPSGRLRAGMLAAGVAFVLTLPSVVADPGAFFGVHSTAAGTGRTVTPWSVWYPLAETVTEVHEVGGERLVAHVREAPSLVGSLAHPLIVLLALLVPLGLALWRRSWRLSGTEAMALLSLLALLRCALDPVDNLYYHEPLLLSLLAWDALAGERRLPWRGAMGAALALLFWQWSQGLEDVAAFNAAYLVVAAAAVLGISIGLQKTWKREKPEFSRDEAQISGIKDRALRSMRPL
ncbi:MAG TPA: glycosyltransferase 87 family protein [Solirubrobacterales bacterium]